MEILKAFYPLIAFLLIWFAVGMYYGKKVKKHRAHLKADLSRPKGLLTLERRVEQTNYLRKYKVIIDNDDVGAISSGETKHFKVKPGKHLIQLKIDWCKTKPHSFEIDSEKNTHLLCGATFNDWRCLYKYAIDASSYIYVKNA